MVSKIVQSQAVAANTLAEAKVRATAGHEVVITALAVSYSAVPAGGNVKLQGIGTAPLLDLDITAGGLTPVPIPNDGICFDPDEQLDVVLAAGGAAVVGKIAVSFYSRPVGASY